MKPSVKDLQKVTQIFRPSAPVEEPGMFIGREEQKQLLNRAILAPGRHIAVYGQRGVGKTSLLNIVIHELKEYKGTTIIKYTCSHKDTYGDIFSKFLDCTNQLLQQQTIRKKTARKLDTKLKILVAEGGIHSTAEEESAIAPVFIQTATPDTIATQYCTRPAVFFIDEFDRITNPETKEMIAETIKILADNHSKTKIVLSGASNSALDLIGAHPSTIRNILTLELLPMPPEEVEVLVTRGFQELNLETDPLVVTLIIRASNGLPYFAHLLCEELAVHSLKQNIKQILPDSFFFVLKTALSNISSIVHSSFDSICKTPRHIFIGDAYSQMISTPMAERRNILMAFALAHENDWEQVSIIFEKLTDSKNEFLPQKYRNLSEEDIKIVLSEICSLSDFLIKDGDNILFRDAFFRGYTWLQAAKRFGKDAIIKIVQK